jgi:hypothetical protein
MLTMAYQATSRARRPAYRALVKRLTQRQIDRIIGVFFHTSTPIPEFYLGQHQVR